MSVRKWIQVAVTIVLLLCAGYVLSKTPAQELKITAVTQNEDFDVSGVTDLYHVQPLYAGDTYTAVIKFMAVKDTTDKLFTSHGTGQYVYLGCNELTARCSFISIGRFLHVRLTMNAAQTDLKLEDGTPFDVTRYSLKPVLVIEE